MNAMRAHRSSLWAVGIIAVIAAGYALLIHLAGPVPTTWVPGDDIIWFDGAYRLFAGQTPHADFYNPLGALYFQVPAWIMAFTGRTLNAFSYAMALFGGLLAALTWFACRPRLPGPFAAGVVVLVLAFLLSLQSYGGRFHDLNFSAYYNKMGLVFLLVVMVLAFCPRADDIPRDRWRVLLISLTLAVSFYVKITHFLLAVGVFVIGECLARRRAPMRAVFTILAVSLLAALIIVGYAAMTGIPLPAYLADLRLAAISKASGWHHYPWVLYLQWTPEFLLSLVVLLGVGCLAMPTGDRDLLFRYVGLLAAGTGIYALLPAIHSQPSHEFFPCTLAVILVGMAWRHGPLVLSAPNLAGAQRWALRSVFAFLLACAGFLAAAPNLAGEIYGRAIPMPRFQGISELIRVPIVGAEPWRFYPRRSRPDDAAYLRGVVAAIPLLKQWTGPRTTIAVLDFSNPFPFLLGTPPPQGGAAWWHVGVTLSGEVAKRLPPPVAGACLVLYPENPFNTASRAFLLSWAEAALARDYALVVETAGWRIWRRREGC